MVSRYKKSGWFKESHRHSLAAKGIKTGRKKIDYMYSLETIREMNRERAKEAEGKSPLTYTGVPEDLRRIPNFGDYRPKGWKLVDTYFVDSSGLGQPGEGALTFAEFTEKAKKGKGYALIEEGQFQVRIGEFEKTKTVDKKPNYAKNKISVDMLKDTLPHGSGIDADWNIYEKGDNMIAENSYHAMDEHGFYVGWADFQLVIPKNNPKDFKLHFQGKDAQYLNQKFMLRDYLEDTVHYSLEEGAKAYKIDYKR